MLGAKLAEVIEDLVLVWAASDGDEWKSPDYRDSAVARRWRRLWIGRPIGWAATVNNHVKKL
jgi:hypothetical protein